MLDNTIHIMDKVLSIIVPTYNMEACLEKNLKSLILEYGEERLEVIVVNDGSTDKSSEIAHTFQTEYPNIFKVIDKENGNWYNIKTTLTTINFQSDSSTFFVQNLDLLGGYLMYMYIGIEDLVANAIIELVEKSQRREVLFSES